MTSINTIIMITGATSGIGKATALQFAELGYSLILCGRRSERLETLKKLLIKDYNINVNCLTFDVRSQEETQSAIASLSDEWRQIEVLVNNAGLAMGLAEFHESNLNHWDTMIDTNIKGLLNVSRSVSPQMVENKHGHIINVCSTAGHEVYPKGHVYCATKHAVDAITKGMRLDFHKYNIKVSQVSPAHVEETEFAEVRFEGDKEKAKIYNDFNPLKSKDVAELIVFMATRPSHVNIQDILVMGTQQANSTNIDRSGRIHD